MKRWPRNDAYFWETAPFFRLLLPLLIGIIAYNCNAIIYNINIVSILECTIILLYAFITFILFIKSNRTKWISLFSISVFLLLLLIGIIISYYYNIINNVNWFGNYQKDYTIATIIDVPTEKENEWKMPVKVVYAIHDNTFVAVTGDAKIYIYKDELPFSMQKGDTLLLPPKWKPIKNSGNPFEFDYANYCILNNLYYTQSCSSKEVRLLAKSNLNYLPLTEKAHDWCVGQLAKALPDPTTLGLIQAMLLGDVSHLDENIKQSWAQTGIIHVIAISGSNVGVFFIMISFLLYWISNHRYLGLKYAISIPIIWFYILMAGMPTSAVRAAIMFTILAFSILLEKPRNGLNELLSAAFILLLMDPLWLYSIGFQLSFLAVLSLILFYSFINGLWRPKNKILKWFWKGIAASIAAEILVAPIVVYYFHNFPILFLIANVIAFVFMEYVLIASMALILMFFIPILPNIIGTIITFVVTYFDKTIFFFQSLQPKPLQLLQISPLELAVILISICFLIIFWMKKNHMSLFITLVLFCILLILSCINKWQTLHQEHFVVYNNGNSIQIELIRGEKYQFWHKDLGLPLNADYVTTPAHIFWKSNTLNTDPCPDYFRIGNKTILLLKDNNINYMDTFPVNYLVICTKEKPDLQYLNSIFMPKAIILSPNYSHKELEKEQLMAKSYGLKVHYTKEDGAFIVDN